MLELWNKWYETVVTVETLATVVVIAVVAAGVISLAESRGVRQNTDRGRRR